MLKSNNGVMNTLATEGKSSKFDFTVQNDGEDVKLETKVVTASIVGTLIDQDPFVVYKIDKVLLPRELFKAAPPATAEEPAAAPAKSKTKKKKDKSSSKSDDEDDVADSPADSPDGEASDQKAADDENGGNSGVKKLNVVVGFVSVLLANWILLN